MLSIAAGLAEKKSAHRRHKTAGAGSYHDVHTRPLDLPLPAPHLGSGHSPLRVLILEHEPAIRQLLEACFTVDGHEAVATEPRTMLENPEALEEIDLIVLSGVDFEAPSSLALVHACKQRAPQAPLMILSSRPDQVTQNPACASAISSVVRKPFLISELRAAVEHAVHHGQGQTEKAS